MGGESRKEGCCDEAVSGSEDVFATSAAAAEQDEGHGDDRAPAAEDVISLESSIAPSVVCSLARGIVPCMNAKPFLCYGIQSLLFYSVRRYMCVCFDVRVPFNPLCKTVTPRKYFAAVRRALLFSGESILLAVIALESGSRRREFLKSAWGSLLPHIQHGVRAVHVDEEIHLLTLSRGLNGEKL